MSICITYNCHDVLSDEDVTIYFLLKLFASARRGLRKSAGHPQANLSTSRFLLVFLFRADPYFECIGTETCQVS
jgi:hypothetical protein